MPTEIEVVCTNGNAKIKTEKRRYTESVMVLTGRRRKWDVLSWSLRGDDEVTIHGLYNGRYGDTNANVEDLISALSQLDSGEAAKVIESINKARS